MSKLTSIYVWLFVAAMFIAANIWILNGFESKVLYADQNNPAHINRLLKHALRLSEELKTKSQNFDTVTAKLVRDPFSLPSSTHLREDFKYSDKKKFFKTHSVALQLPNIDGILTIRRLDGTEVQYLLVKGKMFKVGQSIDGFKVVEVSPDSILMESNGKEFRIAFSKNSYELMAKRASEEAQ